MNFFQRFAVCAVALGMLVLWVALIRSIDHALGLGWGLAALIVSVSALVAIVVK